MADGTYLGKAVRTAASLVREPLVTEVRYGGPVALELDPPIADRKAEEDSRTERVGVLGQPTERIQGSGSAAEGGGHWQLQPFA